MAAPVRVNAVNAAAPASGALSRDELAELVLRNQITTDADMHIYQTPRRQQEQLHQQAPVASTTITKCPIFGKALAEVNVMETWGLTPCFGCSTPC